MKIMDKRHGATAMITVLPTNQWYETTGDITPANAILDIYMHYAN